MYLLVISIVTATAILLLFKVASKFNTNNLHIVTINYFVAACLGIFISLSQGTNISYIQYSWFGWSILYGLFFILGFIFFGYSTQKSGITSTAISSRVSVIIPVILGFLLFKDVINNNIIVGIFFAIISLIFINLQGKSTTLASKSPKIDLIMILPILLFFLIGINDSIIKLAQYYLIKNDNYAEFISSCFIFSSLGGIIIMLIKKDIKIKITSIIFGSVLGIFNFINFKSLMLGLASIPITKFIPIYNIGVVILSSLIGIIALKEKVSTVNIIGILFAVLSIILLTI
jgi:drug/metabolite transporter (DMT)-like permease